MNNNSGTKGRSRSLLIIVFAVLFSIVFSGVSIYNVNLANEKVRTMRDHSFVVTSSAHQVRNNLKESRLWIGRVSDGKEAPDLGILKSRLRALDDENAANIDVLEMQYLGSREDTEAVRESVRQLAQEREKTLRETASMDREGLEAVLRERMDPFYDQTEQALATVIELSNKKSYSLLKESTQINSNNIFTMIFLSVLTIALAGAFYWTFLRKVAEITYRDYLFQVLAENVENVFLIYNRKAGRMEYISPNIERVFGILPENVRDKFGIFSYCETFDSGVRRAFEKEKISERLEMECCLKNPRTRQQGWINFSIFPARDGTAVERYVICLTDLSAAKKSRQALEDALLCAQNANQAKSGFLSSVSHEIRTPMNAIIGMTAIAAAAVGNTARVGDCLTKIGAASRHLLMLINDVLDMSKIENGKLKITKEKFSLRDVITEINSIIYPQVKARNQKFKVSMLDIEHETLVGDALRLNQILLNILSNAVKFTPAGGRIEMQIQEMPHRRHNTARFRFTVSDTGIGIKKDFLEHLFTPFEQDNSNSQKRSGTGLGMAITKNIVSLMGGTIRVESEEMRGTMFAVELNFASEESELLAQKSFDDLKALIVDDEPDCCEHAMVLMRRLGVKADWALSGKEAIEKTTAAYRGGDGYDALFLDWKMPDLDGIETARRIRRDIGPDALIVILTAYDWSEIETEAREAGINGFIAKPLFQSSLYHTLLGVGTPNTPASLPQERSVMDFAGKKFMIVEDNEINMEIALEMLKDTGADIHVAWNGEEAVELFKGAPQGYYDVILMDVQMPVLDGNAAARKIRALPRDDAKKVAILAMTANAFNEDVTASFAAGMNGHVSKPVEKELLIKGITQAMKEMKDKEGLK